MNTSTLIPDWQVPSFIGLIWPYNLPSKRDGLIDFYKALLFSLRYNCPDQNILVLQLPDPTDLVRNTFDTDKINAVIDLNIQDIWIRDFAPFWKRQGDNIIAVKPLYNPSYEDKEHSFRDNEVGIMIGGVRMDAMEIEGIEVILDGGNLTHNGAGTGIMTNRYIADNENIFLDLLIDKTKEYFGLRDLILVPAELGDETGHVDGMVRFLSERKVVVSEYPYEWQWAKEHIGKVDYKASREQLDKVAAHLTSYGLDVYRMPNGIPLKVGELGSAVGNYTNFLRVGDKIFLPKYGIDEQDEHALTALLLAGIEEQNIIPVPDCNEIAGLGGVLNCITTHIYGRH